jgi:outer membrane protein assembly factor BamC
MPELQTRLLSAHNRGPALLARLSVVAMAAMIASGCTILQEEKIDYKSARQGNSLDVPPDLTQLSSESRYNVPGTGTASASGQPVAQVGAAASTTTALNALGDVRIERAGSQRWLLIGRPVDQLWNPVTEFWKENGFILTVDQEKLGIMETDWAENRAKIPQDIIRSTIGKLFDNLYSSGERDKFRTRLERRADGSTEIYVSHRGMEEVYNSVQKDSTIWQPRPSDPELETEFLRRLMIKLGASAEQAQTAVAGAVAIKPTARVVNEAQGPVLVVEEGFDLAWRRVGLSLDRTGFTVEDRNRAQGVYFVRFVPANAADKEKKGFLSGLFGGKSEAKPAQYQFKLVGSTDSTTVTVLDAKGNAAPQADAKRIVELLAGDLN